MLVRSLDHLGVADGASRLNDRRNSAPSRLVHVIAEREKGIRRHHSSVGRWVRLLDTDLYRIYSAHLSCADANRATAGSQYDRVGLHVLGHAPGKIQIAHLLLGRL